MRRAGNLIEAVAEPANLRLAFWKAARGKSGKADVVAYRAALQENLAGLRRDLFAGTPAVGSYSFFTIWEPKQRTICAAAFGERVLHHAIMNIVEPVFERRLIADTYACRVGKGRLAALDRAEEFSRRHGWYLKLDVRRYFESIDHEALLGLLSRVVKDADVHALFERIVSSHASRPGAGLPIGNLTSQHLANLYLGELDLFVKHVLRARGYARYMDDFVLWSRDKEELCGWHRQVADFLARELRLEVKPPQINRSRHGLPFLGCRVFPWGRRLDGTGRRRFARKLDHLERLYRVGELSAAALQQRATALVAHTGNSGGAGFRRRFLSGRDFGAATMDHGGSNRVLRGGNWNNNANNCRCAERNNNSPGNTNNNNGFRTVRSSEGSPKWEKDSDPVAVPTAPDDRGRQNAEARPGLVGLGDSPGLSVPGGPKPNEQIP